MDLLLNFAPSVGTIVSVVLVLYLAHRLLEKQSLEHLITEQEAEADKG
jgi:hypothetical protein